MSCGTLLPENFEERRSLERGKAFASEIVDGTLAFLHSRDVVGQRSLLVGKFGGVEPKKFSKNGAILAVFVDTKFEIFSEGFVEGYN
jgi:hypothetical protein